MRIKSYFAKTVDEAMAQARVELGLDALLLNTRKVVAEAGQPGGYEVVFGLAQEEVPEPVAAEPPPQVESRPVRDDLAGELGRLHARMDEIGNLIARSSRSHLTGNSIPELAAVQGRLVAADVDPLLGQEIVDRVAASLTKDASFQRTGRAPTVDPSRLEALVRAELERRVIVDPRLGVDGARGAVVILVGPTGAGKTTSLMKLAASDLTAGRSVRVLSLDTGRVAPNMQLESFARKLGMGFAMVPAIERLPGIIAEARKKELVLIDTPGFAGNDDHGVETAARVLASCPRLDVHLVVPGYMKAGDLRRCIRRYEGFRPAKLLVTKMDETQTFGSMFSGAAWAGLSLSFMAHGPAIPDDFRPASLEDLVAMVLDRQTALAQRVA